MIIPCFNQAGFLGDAIESALAQLYPRVEVTVVDDGSTDDSAAVARRYEDRVRCLDRPHQGLAAARNAGLRATSGDYVLFLDADDYISPSALTRLMDTAAADPTAAVVHSGWRYVDELRGSVVEAGPYPLAEDPFHMILSGYCPPPNSLVVRRDALESAGPFDEGLALQEDRDMWLRVAAGGHTFVTVPGPLATYRRHAVSMSATASATSVLDATVTVIRKSRTYHPGCSTCARVVAESLYESRIAWLYGVKHDLVTATGRRDRIRRLGGALMAALGEPALIVTALRAGGRRVRRRASLRELALFLHALRLVRLAQRVHGRESLSAVATMMASLPALPRRVDVDAAQAATVRACSRAARWLGLRDTCLVRSLVLASLLSADEAVRLHVGFAPPNAEGRPIEGHAWVSVGGVPAGGPGWAASSDGSTTEFTLSIRRRGCAGGGDDDER